MQIIALAYLATGLVQWRTTTPPGGPRRPMQQLKQWREKAVAKTLAEKVWDAHVVRKGDGEGPNAQPDLLFIDLHPVHEETSPQAIAGLRLAGRKLRRPGLTIATDDHNSPSLAIYKPSADLTSRTQ